MKSKILSIKYLIVAIIAIVSVIAGCKKDNPTDQVNTTIPLAITDISPLNGLSGSVITITGTGFDTTPANDTVKFNGIYANVISATATKMIVTVPAALSGKITLSCNKASTTYPTNFTINTFTTTTLPTAAFSTFPGPAIANIAVDASGNIFGNTKTDTVYKITSAGVKSIFAIVGSKTTVLGGTAIDASGNIYTVGTNDFKIYKITPTGVVSVFAGNGISGFADGQGTAAQFTAPISVVADGSANLYVTDVYRIRKITSAGIVSTFAGGSVPGSADGQGPAATFGALGSLTNIAIDPTGSLYVSEGYSNPAITSATYSIRKISAAGGVTTILAPIPGWVLVGPISFSSFTSLLAVNVAGDFIVPSSFAGSYSNAGGASFGAPVAIVNKAGGFPSYFFDLKYKVPFTSGNYTGITFDALGNLYISVGVVNNPAAYYPFGTPPGVITGSVTTGSMILKFVFK